MLRQISEAPKSNFQSLYFFVESIFWPEMKIFCNFASTSNNNTCYLGTKFFIIKL